MIFLQVWRGFWIVVKVWKIQVTFIILITSNVVIHDGDDDDDDDDDGWW